MWYKSAVYGQWNWVWPNDVVLNWFILVIRQMSRLDDTHNMPLYIILSHINKELTSSAVVYTHITLMFGSEEFGLTFIVDTLAAVHQIPQSDLLSPRPYQYRIYV